MGAKLSKSRSASASPVLTESVSTPPVSTESVPVVVGTAVAVEQPTAEKQPDAAAGGPQQLDLVFTMDCTGSMGAYIQAAKKNIQTIVERLVQSEGYDLRFALVAYRDHPPQDQTYVTKRFPFTEDLAQMRRDLSTLSAQGGGDGPEAVAAGLKATLDSSWRPNATKVCILIADAPPHGLGESGDGFPNGAPDGVDPLEVLDQMSMHGICIYSVGCEPALSGYKHAKAFMVAAAEKTNGQAVALGSAAALADVIMGGAIEEMDLQQLADEVVEEVRQLRSAAPGMDDDHYKAKAWEAIQARGHTTRHMQSKKLKAKHAKLMCASATLAEARATLSTAEPPSPRRRAAPLKGRARRAAAPRGAVTRSLAALAPGAPSGEAGAALEEGHFERAFSGDEDECMSYGGSRGSLAAGSSDDESDAGSDAGSDGEAAGGKEGGGVRLETRALSFSQMSRVYGRQKKMGLF